MEYQQKDLGRTLIRLIPYIGLVIISVSVLLPFAFTISASVVHQFIGVKSLSELIPQNPTLEHYRKLVGGHIFLRWVFNSVFVAGVVSVAKMFIDSLAGYAFAKIKFPGRKILLFLCLSTMAVPFVVTFLPNFFIMKHMHWINTYWSLIIPPLATPLGVFLAIQFIRIIPTELIEASRIDGCSEFGIYWKVILPVCKPLLASIAIYYFLVTWIGFLWPFIVTTQRAMKVIPVGMSEFRTKYATDYSVIGAMAILSLLPIGVFFLTMQKYFVMVVGLSVGKK